MAQQLVETELHVAGVNSECLPEATESPQQRVHARERGCRWQRSGPRPKEHSYRAAKVEEKLEVHLVRMLGDALQDEREQRRVWALLDDARVRGEELRWREREGLGARPEWEWKQECSSSAESNSGRSITTRPGSSPAARHLFQDQTLHAVRIRAAPSRRS